MKRSSCSKVNNGQEYQPRNQLSDFDHLARWVEKKPLVLSSFSKSYSEAMQSSRAGFEKFTFTQPHRIFDGIKLPTVCLIELEEENESRPEDYRCLQLHGFIRWDDLLSCLPFREESEDRLFLQRFCIFLPKEGECRFC